MTKKEIKDYLHLYLGCDCIVSNPLINSETKRVVSVNKDTEQCEIYYWNEPHLDGEKVHPIEDIKPILRPLSDMTEEEGVEIFWQPVKGENFSIKTGQEFKQLLDKHFDLFGLIEAGLAIDKTTLK